MDFIWWLIGVPVGVVFLVFGLTFVISWFKYKKLPKGRTVPKRSLFLRLFIDFPMRFWNDFFHRVPDEFKEYGFHIVCGKQGSGKTITVVYLLLRYMQMYPKLVVRTNFNFKPENASITDWKDLVFSNNGIYGQIDVLDEVQNWFSSNESKDFPASMLQEVTQQRKQRKMILGTAQRFNRVAKPLREQAFLVYEPVTILGCLTVVRVVEPLLDCEGNVEKRKWRKVFCFVQNDEIRNAFDTYKKIERLSVVGMSDRFERVK